MARRATTTFNMSFLDVMSCGFGAVVLFYMIISAQVSVRADKENIELLGETNRMEEEILDGRKGLVRLKTSIDESQEIRSRREAEQERIQDQLDELREKLSKLDTTSLAARQSVEELQSDIKKLEEAKKKLLSDIEAQDDESGSSVRAYVGDGNRQYLTGMKMDGKRILILVDASASMLGRTYVNAIVYRNMADDLKVRTPKWRSAIDAVDWITTRIPKDADFRIMAFNTTAWDVSDGNWQPVADGERLSAAINRLRTTVPDQGTSLYNVFAAIDAMATKPDNIYLLTDGLPTQGNKKPDKEKLIKPDNRVKFFVQAADQLPGGIPVNVMLFPMDGDPDAAGLFWRLAIDTRGSFMTPSSDWP
ncbi:MAG: VWA domain-containing protein [Gammaproteobacteria bacterium]